jgi:uncharacterized integral membrane protein
MYRLQPTKTILSIFTEEVTSRGTHSTLPCLLLLLFLLLLLQNGMSVSFSRNTGDHTQL